jgi:hypothetical protein
MKIIFSILLVAITMAVTSCTKPDPDSFIGTIESIENGKDGYVAILNDKEGGRFEAIFSIPNIGTNYKRWQVGDELYIKGDTIHINNTYRVIAREVEKK